ncbi:MAG TPA: hypothetical protein VGC68_09490 [Enterovirga sp.]
MGNVGYGNHEPPPVASRGEGADPKNASQKPGAGSQDRPGMDNSATGQMRGSRSNPDPSGQGPHSGQRDTSSPVLTDANTDEIRTPGTGALGTNPQGDEVDPGAG